MKIKFLSLLFLIIAGCTKPVNVSYPSGTYIDNAALGETAEPIPTLIFKGNTAQMTAGDGNELLFTYTLSGTYTSFSGGFINLKNTTTSAISKQPFEYVASEDCVVLDTYTTLCEI
jgi:hypothetical protein